MLVTDSDRMRKHASSYGCKGMIAIAILRLMSIGSDWGILRMTSVTINRYFMQASASFDWINKTADSRCNMTIF